MIVFITFICFSTLAGNAQQTVAIAPLPRSSELLRVSASLPPREDAPSREEIVEYLHLSGDLDSFRIRWIDAFDKNRSIGAPYWPKSFYSDAKAEMQAVDLLPMYVILFQHGVSTQLMKATISAYKLLGTEHFKGSTACLQFGEAESSMEADMDKLKLAETSDVLTRVYDAHKAEIKAARVQYMKDHPEWKD